MKLLGMALTLLPLMAGAAGESALVWREPLVAFWTGKTYLGYDAFECNCPHRVAEGALTLTCTGPRLRVRPFLYAPQIPFMGPEEIVVETDPVACGTSAVLSVKARVRGAKPLSFTAAWKDGRAVFKTALDPQKEYAFDALDFVLTNAAKVGTFALRNVEGRHRTPFAAAVTMEVTTKSPFHVLDWHSAEAAVVRLGNRSERPLRVTGILAVRNIYGGAFELPVDATLPARGTVGLTLPRDGKGTAAKGVWALTATLTAEDGSTCVRTDRFAVLDEHDVTPKIPYGKFRAGIHCHSARGLDTDGALIHDAAVRMGAKIVRIDDAFSQFVTWDAQKNDHDFAKAERFLAELERRGLAVDAIVEECRFKHFTADFCERFARHFGERIDYYEIGNEWDLATADWLTPDQAVAWQKFAFDALRKGNLKARIATNGWAVEDSAGHANVTQKGFQETFMREASGTYDVYAMHLHVPYPEFARRMRRFEELRKANGIATPFIMNETAVCVRYRGEEEVADNVWFKILYAWAHGAQDYIWYNLRNSQFDPNGCWGVMSRTYRPLLTYAAFSGFAAALGDHDFERILVEKEGRCIYRFNRRSGSETVLAGWDIGTMTPIPVTVATDAKRVFQADIMNNRCEHKLANGCVTIAIAPSPRAWIFEGATFVTPAAALQLAAKAPPRVIRVSPVRPDYGWDMLLDKYAQVHEEYPADPATAHRTWKGPTDCSGILLFGLKDGRPTVYISVLDEKDTPGDGVQVWRDGRDITAALSLTRSRQGNRTVYKGAWPDTAASHVNVRFLDDDGFGGLDGWIDYKPFVATAPDASAWPIVRFE